MRHRGSVAWPRSERPRDTRLPANYDACVRSLERARALLARGRTELGCPVIGTTNLTDPAEKVMGWCLYDLGRPRTAAQVIEMQLARVPERAASAYGSRSPRPQTARSTAPAALGGSVLGLHPRAADRLRRSLRRNLRRYFVMGLRLDCDPAHATRLLTYFLIWMGTTMADHRTMRDRSFRVPATASVNRQPSTRLEGVRIPSLTGMP